MSYFIRSEIPNLFYQAGKEHPECNEVLDNLFQKINKQAKRKCFAEWDIDDVLEMAVYKNINLTEEQAMNILVEMEGGQDCELGISWDTLICYVEEYKE